MQRQSDNVEIAAIHSLDEASCAPLNRIGARLVEWFTTRDGARNFSFTEFREGDERRFDRAAEFAVGQSNHGDTREHAMRAAAQ